MHNGKRFAVRRDGEKKINLRVSKEEYERIKQLADSRRMTISSYMRFASLGRRTSHKSEVLRSLREIYFSIESTTNKCGIDEQLMFEIKQKLAAIHDAVETADSAILSGATR